MSTASDIEIEVFRLGRQTDKDGVVVSFGLAEATAMIAAYDPAADPAPLVVGHPKTEDAAYGWVKGFRLDGDVLMASVEQVEPAFAEIVNAGRYKRISPEFYLPASPRNPKPGAFYPKHIGFLGAAAPAIKGLKPVAFAAEAGPGDTVRFEFHRSPTDQEIEMAEKVDTAAFAEQQAKLNDERAQLAADRAALAADRAAARHRDSVAFAEAQITAGKLAPGGRDKVVGLLDRLSESDETVKFSEGVELTPADAFRSLFADAQPVVSFAEVAPADRARGDTVKFAAPPGYSVDPAQAAVHARALELQRADPKLNYADAAIQASA